MSYPGHSHSPSVPNLSNAAMDPLQQSFANMNIGGGHAYGHHGQIPGPQPGHRRRGSCKFFNSQKGFGFVNDDHAEELGGQEVFVHYTAISTKGGFRSLAEGEEVEYEIVTGPKGFQAANLTGPGGRSVIGDPKARLPKPHQFMSLSPMHPLLNPALMQSMQSMYGAAADPSFGQQGYGQPMGGYYGGLPGSMHGQSLSLSHVPYSTGAPASRNLMPFQGTPVNSGINGLSSTLGQGNMNGYNSYPTQAGGRSPYGVPGNTSSYPGIPNGGQQAVFGQTTGPGAASNGPSASHLYNGVNRGAVGDGSPSRANSSRFNNNRNSTPPPAQTGSSSNTSAQVPVPSGVAASHVRTDSTGGSVDRPASKNEGQVNGATAAATNGATGTPTQSGAGGFF